MEIEDLQKEIEELKDSIGAVSSAIKTHDHDGDNSSYLVDLLRFNQNYNISGIKTLSAGTGVSGEVFKFNAQTSTGLTGGFWMGAETFASAKTDTFAIDMKGNVFAKSLVVTGGSIDGTTITGSLIRTAASGTRVQMETTGGYANCFTVYVGANLVGAISGSGSDLHIQDPIISGEIHLMVGSSVDINCSGGTVYAKDLFPAVDDFYDLGGTSYYWKSLYLTGNITVAGTVDGVNISSHTHSGAGQGGTVAHSSLGSIGASDHHSSTSNGLAITPSTVTLSNLLYTYKRSGAPGTASSSYLGSIYYDTAACDLVFCAYDPGASAYKWYKITATEL